MLRFLIATALIATPAAAEVVKATPAGFEVKQEVTIDAPAAQVWATLVTPARWWSKDHTYSDDAGNLYLDPQATGCFCERLKDKGSVEHMHVVYVQPPRALRMTGALGPLQAEAAQGTMAVVLTPDGDKATRVVMTYVAGGYIRAGADTLASKVDEVLALQMLGLKSAAEQTPEKPSGPTPEKPGR